MPSSRASFRSPAPCSTLWAGGRRADHTTEATSLPRPAGPDLSRGANGATCDETREDDVAHLRGGLSCSGDSAGPGLRAPRSQPRTPGRGGTRGGLHAPLPRGCPRGPDPARPRGPHPRHGRDRAGRGESPVPTSGAVARVKGDLRRASRALGVSRRCKGSAGRSCPGGRRDAPAPSRAKRARSPRVPTVADVDSAGLPGFLLAHGGRAPDGTLGTDRGRVFRSAWPDRRGSCLAEVAPRPRRLQAAPRRVEPAREERLSPRRHGDSNR